MHTEPLLLTLATISTVAAQLYYNDALRDPVDFWSDYGDYLARVLGDTVSVVTAGQDSTHTTYHLNCAGPSASMDAYGCIVGNGATVVRGQNIINMRTVLNGETISQRCNYGPTESPVCTIVRYADGTSSATTMTADPSDIGLMTPSATRTQTTDASASTKASATVNTASATLTAPNESALSTGDLETDSTVGTATESDSQPTAEAMDNAGVARATGDVWVFGCVGMAIALAVV